MKRCKFCHNTGMVAFVFVALHSAKLITCLKGAVERVALWIFFYFTQHLSFPVNTLGTHPSLSSSPSLWRSFHPSLWPRRCHIITWRCKQPKNYLFHTDFSRTHTFSEHTHTLRYLYTLSPVARWVFLPLSINFYHIDMFVLSDS